MVQPVSASQKIPKPKWLKVPFPGGPRYAWIKDKVVSLELSTVCEEARCPNIGECWNGGTATFMLMGDTCTRGCRFCSVHSAKEPAPLDEKEPQKLAETLGQMKLTYVVLTTVDRDDLPDQGAGHIAGCIRAVKIKNPELLIEILIPDFRGEMPLVQKVLKAKPSVLAHNIETVERLTDKVRDRRAGYHQSLEVLGYIKKMNPEQLTKSSIMLGLGETRDEVIQTMQDLRDQNVNFLTIGQYLQPSTKHLAVEHYVNPEEFRDLENLGQEMGFEYVASGPLVRSSYKAAEYFIERKLKNSSSGNYAT
ncbi:MAG: lipoyl synthase [SAR324 cluster bacterium]|nr:lipoyl synthase [SAR324 cluster bacterium]